LQASLFQLLGARIAITAFGARKNCEKTCKVAQFFAYLGSEKDHAMTLSAGIVGASGYGGAELIRLLAGHDAIRLDTIAAHSQAGKPVASLYPNLVSAGTFDAVNPEQLATLDLVFLATPHGPALELGAALYDAGTKVVDLSAAFRLSSAAFLQWYKEAHPRPELAAGDPKAHADVVYGLPEFHRDALTTATLVASPGCYPTATLLGLRPLIGLIDTDTIIVDAKSGTSGAGREPNDGQHFAHVSGNFTAYGAPSHRHTGEIERWLGHPVGPISFTPHLVPMSRGILITAYAALKEGITQNDVTAALMSQYANEPFVEVLAAGSFPHTKAVAGTNACHLSALVDPRTNRVVVTAAIDNLGKGAAGQALQSANIMCGLPETTGLSTIGLYP